MYKKIINILYLLSSIFFIIFIINFYFSEKNIITTNKSRLYYSDIDLSKKLDIPLLKNDTQNIIEYTNDVEIYKKKKKKYKFFDLIKNK
tara:strand:- start:8091 stop:8357 length:267 start_codon:yes stop_codon:yes gene_type:complete